MPFKVSHSLSTLRHYHHPARLCERYHFRGVPVISNEVRNLKARNLEVRNLEVRNLKVRNLKVRNLEVRNLTGA